MAGSAAIGNLAVNLSMETAAFTTGATKAQAELRGLQTAAQSMGGGFTSLGSSTNNARIASLELAHVTRSLAEQLSMGVNPARAFAMEIGRISTAVQYGGGIGGIARMIAPLAAPFAAIAAVAGVAFGAIKRFQDQIKDSGVLDKFAASSRLSAEQIKVLGGEVEYTGHNIRTVTGLTVTFGDVMAGVFAELEKESGKGGAWENMSTSASNAFSNILSFWNKTSAAISAGLWTLGSIAKDVFQFIAQQIGKGFYDGVNKAVDAINGLNAKIPKWLGGGDANLIPHLKVDKSVSTLGGLGATIRKQADANYAAALAANQSAYGGIEDAALKHRLDALKKLNDAVNPPKGAKAKKQGDHGLAQALAELDAQIKGQNALAAAYQISDAAVIKAEALQKAEEEAIRHKGETGVFYEKELAKAVATQTAEGAKTLANLRFETGARKTANDAVAAGTMTLAEANQQVKLEETLRPLVAAAAVAEGKAKANLLAVIERLTSAQAASNAETSREQALKAEASNDNDIQRLQLEASLIGSSNKERAVALAQLEAMQKLQEMPGLSEEERQTYILSATAKALASVRTPFQEWADSVPKTADRINEALQTIEFKGFDGLATAISDVITGTSSLKEAFSSLAKSIISDIIQMTVRMLIFKAISGIMGQSNTGIVVTGGGYTGNAYDVPKMANGGAGVFGGFGGVDQNVLSLNGSPIARVSKGEAFNVGNDNSPGNFVVNQYNNFAGGAVTRDDLARMHSVTVAAAKAAVAEEQRRRG